jgi:hypothetical protein
MKKNFVMPLLLLSAAFVTPAYANYFSNPQLGVNYNIGSAPNPTPKDIRDNSMPVVEAAPAPDAAVTASEEQDMHKTADGNNQHASLPTARATESARVASQAH